MKKSLASRTPRELFMSAVRQVVKGRNDREFLIDEIVGRLVETKDLFAVWRLLRNDEEECFKKYKHQLSANRNTYT